MTSAHQAYGVKVAFVAGDETCSIPTVRPAHLKAELQIPHETTLGDVHTTGTHQGLFGVRVTAADPG